MNIKRSHKMSTWILCFMILISISPVLDWNWSSRVEAFDVGSSPVTGLTAFTIVEQEQANLKDIAWKTNVPFLYPQDPLVAVAVGMNQDGTQGLAYRYDGNTDEWVKLNHPSGTPLYGIQYHNGLDSFIIVGDGQAGGMNRASVFITDGYDDLLPYQGGRSGDIYYDLAYNTFNRAIFVGPGMVTFYGGNGDWQGGLTVDPDFTYNSALDFGDNFYFVGSFEGTGILYDYTVGNDPVPISPPDHHSFTEDDIWNKPLYGVTRGKSNEILILGEEVVEVYHTTYGFLYDEPAEGFKEGETFLDAVWIPGRETAYLVGYAEFEQEESGLIYQYRGDLHRISQVPGGMMDGRQHGVAISRDEPYTIICVGYTVGNEEAAHRLSETSVFDEMITEVIHPEILSVNMYRVGQNKDLLDSQIDVNPHDVTVREYELNFVVRHEAPGEQLYGTLTAWYDNGFTGEDSIPPSDTYRNNMFIVDWLGGSDFQWFRPQLDGDQQEIVPGEHTIIDESIPGEYDQFNITFRFIPGPQMRFANGFHGNFNDKTDTSSKNGGLTTPNTWDFEIGIESNGGGQAFYYGEFGVYRFISLTVSGLPGAYTAIGAPGMYEFELTPTGGTNVTFSANCEHSLKVYLETDLYGISTGEFIPAEMISFEGGYQEKGYLQGPGENNAVYILGDPLGDNWNQPRYRYNYTTTTINTIDETSTPYPAIRWWVDICTFPEDSYRTNLIYVLEHSGG